MLNKGTLKEIKADAPNFEAYCLKEARKALESMPDTYSDFFEKEITKGNCRYFHIAQKSPSGFTWYRGDSSNYEHLLQVGLSPRSDYTTANVKLRKDGTINTDTLSQALHKWIRKELATNQARQIHDTNRAEYEALGEPFKDSACFTVKLSRSVVGQCTIEYNDFSTMKFHPVKCRIDQIESVASVMNTTVELYKAEFETCLH